MNRPHWLHKSDDLQCPLQEARDALLCVDDVLTALSMKDNGGIHKESAVYLSEALLRTRQQIEKALERLEGTPGNVLVPDETITDLDAYNLWKARRAREAAGGGNADNGDDELGAQDGAR